MPRLEAKDEHSAADRAEQDGNPKRHPVSPYENGPPATWTSGPLAVVDDRKAGQAFLSILRPHAAATTMAAMPIISGTARSTIA